MYLVDPNISETEWSQNLIPSRLYLWPVLLYRHPGNAHDWQLHSMQLLLMCPWFLSDRPETYYYPVHQYDPEDQIGVVVIDFCVLFLLHHHPQGLNLKTGMFLNGCSITSYMMSSH